MSIKKFITAAFMVICGLLVNLSLAHAYTITWITQSTLNQVEGTPDFIAEGRIGDNNASGTEHELDLYKTTGGPFPIGTTANFVYGNGTPYDFSLSYVAATNQATFSFNTGGPSPITLTYTNPDTKTFNSIFIRAFANQTTSYSSALQLTNLSLTIGGSPNSLPEVVANSSDPTKILWLQGITTQDFILTGTAALSWTGTTPQRSNLAFQLKATNATPIPGSVVLLGSGLLGLGVLGYRRKRSR